MFNLGEAILALLEIVFGFWNNQVSLVFELLGQSPTGFKGGGPWGIIEGIEPLFVGIGSALVVLFFVIGFCAESVDIREEIRFEAILRMFIRVAIAQWLVSYNITIMKALFTSCGNLVGHLGQNQSVELSIDPAQAEVIKDLGFGTSIVFLILAVFLSLIVIICGFFLLYNVYFRFLKIMVIVPFGAIASSTLAGNRGLSNTFVAYMKYFIEDIAENMGSKGRWVLSNSRCLSADVNAAFDPTFAEPFERNNASYVNYGAVLTKYTGAGGKSSTSDAGAEFVGEISRIMDGKNVVWQTGELGKVDFGGGGTVAKYVAELNVDVIDLGVPVLSMHAPFEVISKLDLYMTFKAVEALYSSER